MANDFQLTTNTQAAADFWTQGGSALAPYSPPAAASGNGNGSSGKPPATPMQKMHRLLRGRYPAAICLAAFGAVAGALGGWMALPPKYESAGLVMINYAISSPGPHEDVLPMLTTFIQGQVGLLTSTRVAQTALADKHFIDAWKKKENFGDAPLPEVADFLAAVDVEHLKNGPLITVAFDNKRKEVAEAGCKALIHAYVQLHGSGDELDEQKKIDYNNADLAKQERELKFKRTQLDQLAEQYGTADLGSRDQLMQSNLATLEGNLEQAKVALDTATAATNGKHVNNTDREFIYQQIGGIDNTMSNNLKLRENALLALQDIQAKGVLPRHPSYIAADQLYKDSQKRVDDYAKDFLAAHQDRIPFRLDDNTGQSQDVDLLKERVQSLTKLVDENRVKAEEIGKVRQQIEDTRAEIQQIVVRRDSDLRNIEALQAELALTKNIVIEDYGSEATLPSDKRKLLAGLGFGLGGILPVGLMLLYGLTENRFRFSDDTTHADLAGVTLLGILPNLPDRLSDPQQAGIAAHCVHQIRTMLQISRSNDEPQVVAVTSASSGDGKTSLTLALGLSYAACGARTLLIDCDLLAAGLTHRLNVTSADGVLEAVANRVLLEFVRTTDIADVAILPVGTTHAHHASTLSPVSLRRLLSEAKRHFDIIIVDTGPILGSIEASLVCAAADRTILAVARNQQRPLVEKSISHLQSIGANLAGVVFNRAQASDFERSMNGLSLRSRPSNGTEKPTAAGTATASAVAGSFKRAG
jgi:capsular exopolysaccharide synthesis family protein